MERLYLLPTIQIEKLDEARWRFTAAWLIVYLDIIFRVHK